MRIKRINIGWSSMTGFGPTAWGQDRQILNMHTPHHEEHRHSEYADDDKTAATNQCDAKSSKKAPE